MTQPLRILFVEDLPTDQELAAWQLRAGGVDFIFQRVETRDAFLQALDDFQPDLIISDYAMPEFNGMQALELTLELKRDIPFIVLTGSMNEETAADCIKAGASDYVIKEHIHRLPFAVQEVLKQQKVRKEKERAEQQLRLQATALDSAANAILITDREGAIEWINPAYTLLTGYSAKEAIGQTPRMLKSGVQDQTYYQHMWDSILSGKVWRGELVNKRKDGRLYTEEETITPLMGPSGNVEHFIAIKVDITERRQAEKLQDAIYRIAQAADLAESPDALYPSIHSIIQEVMAANNFYIALYDEKNDLISFPYCVDEIDPLPAPKKPGKGFTEYVLHTAKSLLCDEALFEELKQGGEVDLIGRHSPSWLGVPLVFADKVIGVMVVQDYENERAYTEREQHILEFVSTQVAMAIHRKQQEAEIIKNLEDINLLYEAGKQLSQSLDLQSIYLAFYKLISNVIKCDGLYIADFDSQSKMITAKFAVMEGEMVDVSAFPAIPLEPEGSGIQSPVIRSGKSRIINDYPAALKQTKTNYFVNEQGKIFEKEAVSQDELVTQSSLIVPILLNNQVMGLVQLQCYEKDAYSAKNLKIAEALVSQIAVAANNAQLYQQSLKEIESRIRAETALWIRSHRQEKMAALGRDLAATLDLEIIYRTAEIYLKEMIDCPNYGITLLDRQNSLLTSVYFVTDGVNIDPTTLPPVKFNPEDSASGHSKAIADKKPVIVLDLAARRKAINGMLVGSEQEPETAIYIPILVADEVIGLLDLQSYQKNAYSEEDGEWLSVVANQIGLAMQNARQLIQTQRRIAELQILYNIDQAITTNVDATKRHQKILEQIATLSHVDAADILIFDPQEKLLEYTAGIGFSSSVVTKMCLHLGEGLASQVAQCRRPIQFPNLTGEVPDSFYNTLWEKEGYATYLGLPLLFGGELKGVLEIYCRKTLIPEPGWLNFMESLAQQVAIAIDNSQLFHGLQEANRELLQAYDATITGWSQAMDMRDKETEGHTERVTNLTLEIAKTLGVNEENLVHVKRGALMHDIGKLGVPDRILFKPGSLTDDEWVIMKRHPVLAHEMLSSIDYLRPALAIPYCHHEKWDGSGYPRGLKGEQIPLEARIFALVDVYDALTTDRPYREAWSQEQALAYIQEQSGSHFDPNITAAFLDLLRE